MNQKRQKKAEIGRTGFSLIEVMIALAIFAIGFLAVAAMQINSVQHVNHARKVTVAQNLAKREVEYLQGLPFYDASKDLDNNGTVNNFDIVPVLDAGGHTLPDPASSLYSEQLKWTGGYTIHWNVVDNDPIPAVPDIYTNSPSDPAYITVSKTITVTVTADNDPRHTVLASLVMVKVWDTE